MSALADKYALAKADLAVMLLENSKLKAKAALADELAEALRDVVNDEGCCEPNEWQCPQCRGRKVLTTYNKLKKGS